ncbi:hypothetical protein DNK03_21630 [Brucella anthropi]|uniref:aminopeptidase P family N-terminal domain-containing protein n=1 Tax=Brucella anthropi TaxID=529 RepID=UPI000DECA0A6|nr:aminopeptidase P family N-terminal domain-containing protein [Brucella anthropi]RCI77228.1 hypothetical protein DNK03_21630 [Brucella anthropi]
MGNARLKEIKLPEFGVPTERPELASEIYKARFGRFVDRAWAAGLDAIVVYADREHCANLSYLTAFDPRFEEALLVVAKGGEPVIITGPENQGSAAASKIPVDVYLYQPFGLLGQNREHTPSLDELFAKAGVSKGAKIGAIGWKYFTLKETGTPEAWLDLPSYLADALRSRGSVVNATRVMMDPSSGLRATLELEELAQFEFAATHGSESIKRVMNGVRPGMREFEVASLMRPIGLPLGAHMMLSSGERANLGLNSPSDRVINRGDQFTTAFSYWGSLTARAGFVAESADDLPDGAKDYVEKLVAPYFETAAEWYETVGIGVSGGLLDAQVRKRLDTPFFNLILNPGHLIHLDEWMSTPIYPGSTEVLHSKSALQLDIIPATGSVYYTTNIEDGIALLDKAERSEFAERFPAAWDRIQKRRSFMADELGIVLKDEVLPFSNTSGYLRPFLLAPGLAMSKK